MTKEEVLIGLQEGRTLHCDRKDEPLLPWLLSHPNVESNFVEVPEQQYSVISFRWRFVEGQPII